MNAGDRLEAGLARISGRLQAQRDRVRAELAKEPRLHDLAEAARERFGAKLTWLRTGEFEFGREPPAGVRPGPAFKVKRRRAPA